MQAILLIWGMFNGQKGCHEWINLHNNDVKIKSIPIHSNLSENKIYGNITNS